MTDKVTLEINARGYTPDVVLDRAADLIEAAVTSGDWDAFLALPDQVQDLASIHKDFRDSYRVAVRAGVIPDDRGPSGQQAASTAVDHPAGSREADLAQIEADLKADADMRDGIIT